MPQYTYLDYYQFYNQIQQINYQSYLQSLYQEGLTIPEPIQG